eukprot:2255902-Pyramimonas_sp.AAC.1
MLLLILPCTCVFCVICRARVSYAELLCVLLCSDLLWLCCRAPRAPPWSAAPMRALPHYCVLCRALKVKG